MVLPDLANGLYSQDKNSVLANQPGVRIVTVVKLNGMDQLPHLGLYLLLAHLLHLTTYSSRRPTVEDKLVLDPLQSLSAVHC